MVYFTRCVRMFVLKCFAQINLTTKHRRPEPSHEKSWIHVHTAWCSPRTKPVSPHLEIN